MSTYIRRWRHLNTMQWKTFVECAVPRVSYLEHGVHQVRVPWAEDQSRFTAMFEAFTIDVLEAVRSKVQAEKLTGLSWDQVDRLMTQAVKRGLEGREFGAIRYLGIDEKSFGRGHDYASVLCDLDRKCVIDVVPERTKQDAIQLLETLPEPQRESVQAIALDMWDPFMKAAHHALPRAVDHFRRAEHREFSREGQDDIVKKSKYVWLKNPANWTDPQRARFESLKIDALQEAFQDFWSYRYAGCARKLFDW